MAVDDAFTKALLHMDGADASTTFTDESGKTWTANGNAQIDTAQSKFGGASGLFDGTGDYITTPDSDDFYLGTGKFTVDFWIRFTSIGLYNFVFGQTTDANNFYGIEIRSNMIDLLSLTGAASDFNITAATTFVTGVWYHVAVVRDGTTSSDWHFFNNGIELTKTLVSGSYGGNCSNYTGVFNIGASATGFLGNPLNGHVDEFRFSKGIARWTANFTPPTSAYALPYSGLWSFF